VAETRFELIALCPAAPGWRAVYSGGRGPQPVLAWGVFRKRRGTKVLGTSMEGLVAEPQAIGAGPGSTRHVRYFGCAAEPTNFEAYLPPEG